MAVEYWTEKKTFHKEIEHHDKHHSRHFSNNQILEYIESLAVRPVENVGIHGIDVYFPKQYVSQEELEEYDGVSKGKYTVGLGQKNMAVCDHSEDIVSMSKTVLDNLFEKYGISEYEVGRLEVGTETLTDKSKSVKTHLMERFNQCGVYDVLGCDNINACYGGTNAVLNAVNWIESNSYESGKYAVVICGDNAVYGKGPGRPTGGAGVVAMLIGPDAPITIDTKNIASHMENQYDFYKPQMSSEYPFVDGKLSNDCYTRALESCIKMYTKKSALSGGVFDFGEYSNAIFHAPYGKLVQKSYKKLEDVTGVRREYGDVVEPTLLLSNECGNMYTGSVYASIASLIHTSEGLANTKTLVFSYGSGLTSSIFSLKFNRDVTFMKNAMRLGERLDERVKITPEHFSSILDRREYNYSLGVPKTVSFTEPSSKLFPGTYYRHSFDDMGRRKYVRKLHTILRKIPK